MKKKIKKNARAALDKSAKPDPVEAGQAPSKISLLIEYDVATREARLVHSSPEGLPLSLVNQALYATAEANAVAVAVYLLSQKSATEAKPDP